MSVLLGLVPFCLAAFFLSLFLQLAKLERLFSDAVVELERYMMRRHGLQEKKDEAEGQAPAAPAKGK